MGMPGVTFIQQGEQQRLDEPFKRLHDLAMIMEKKRDEEALQTVKKFEYAMEKGMPISPKMQKQFEKAMSRLGIQLPRTKSEWEGAAEALAAQGTGNITPNQAASLGGAMQGDIGGAQAAEEVSRSARSQGPEGGLTGQHVATQALQSAVGGGIGGTVVQNPAESRNIVHDTVTGTTQMAGGRPGAPAAPVEQGSEVVRATSAPIENAPGYTPPQWIQNWQLAEQQRRVRDVEQTQRDTQADRLIQRLMNGDKLTPGQLGMALARFGISPTEPQLSVLGMTQKEYADLKEMHLGAETPAARNIREQNLQMELLRGNLLLPMLENQQDLYKAAELISQGIDPRSIGIPMKRDIRHTVERTNMAIKYMELGVPWHDAYAMATVDLFGGSGTSLLPATFQTTYELNAKQMQANIEATKAGADVARSEHLLNLEKFKLEAQRLQLLLDQVSLEAETSDQKEKLETFTALFDLMNESRDRRVRNALYDSGTFQQIVLDLADSLGWEAKKKENWWRSIRSFFGARDAFEIGRPGALFTPEGTPATEETPSATLEGLRQLGGAGIGAAKFVEPLIP